MQDERSGEDGVAADRKLRIGLAFSILGGMLAWVLHLGGSYALVPVVCATEREALLHGMTGAMALVAAGAAWAGWRTRSRLSTFEDSSDPHLPVFRFLALSGLVLSAFFFMLILFEGLPALLQGDACGPVPTLDSPIIHLEPEGPPSWALLLLVVHGNWPLPGEHWGAWSWDPWIGGVMLVLTALYLSGVTRLWRRAGRGRGIARWRVASYLAGMAALVLALNSPVHAVGGALFSVHMVQHMLLMVVAAPLLVLGLPLVGYLWGLPQPAREQLSGAWSKLGPARAGWGMIAHPLVILVLHVGALWVWHVPALYQAALENQALHHLEHASFFFTAILFWWALAETGRRGRWPGYGAGVLYVFATTLQSGALGALLLFASSPWYPDHAEGTAAWGVDLLVDQQVAGAIMWIPAGIVYAFAAVLLFLAWLRESGREVDRSERVRAVPVREA
jgi:putative membrane protein